MWCFICFLKTTKFSNTLIVISSVLLIQMNRKRNMIMFLLQQDKLLMACSMIHQMKPKTMRKAKEIIQNMVMEVRRRRRCRHQLRQLKISLMWTNRILQMQNIFNMEFLTLDASRKLNGK